MTWWCPYCESVVQPDMVNYDFRHDERSGGCGKHVRVSDNMITDNTAVIRALDARIAVLDRQAQGYYNQASEGWSKYRQAEARIAELEKELATAQAFAHWVVIERDKLQKICAATYQLAGLVGAPERFLDALSRHEYTEDLLPVRDEEIECMAQLAELREAAGELVANAEWDGDISTVDTGDLKALRAELLQEPPHPLPERR